MKKKLVLLFCIFAFGLLPYAYSVEQVAAYENKAPDYVKWSGSADDFGTRIARKGEQRKRAKPSRVTGCRACPQASTS